MDFFLFFLPPFFPVCMPFLFLNKNGRLSKKMIINSSLGKEIGRLGNKSEREIDFWLCALLNCLFFPLFSFYHGMYYQLKKKSPSSIFSVACSLDLVFSVTWCCHWGDVDFEMLTNSWWSSEWNKIQYAFYLHGACLYEQFHVHKRCAKNVMSLWVKRAKFSILIVLNSLSTYMNVWWIWKAIKDAGQSHALQMCNIPGPCPLNASRMPWSVQHPHFQNIP